MDITFTTKAECFYFLRIDHSATGISEGKGWCGTTVVNSEIVQTGNPCIIDHQAICSGSPVDRISKRTALVSDVEDIISGVAI